MGYSTDFRGELKFTTELRASELAYLRSILGEDARDHREWNAGDLTYIDLELTDAFDGIRWNGSEKTYGMVEAVNLITRLMRERAPEFRLEGSLLAQGEDSDDRWMLVMDASGVASKDEIRLTGERVECPNCGHTFRNESVAERAKEQP
jgi:hypothetical protein